MLDGDPAFPPQKGTQPLPQFSAHVYYGQTAGFITIPLGTEVGLSPGDFVLDGDPAPLPKKGAEPPISVHFYYGQTAACIRIPLGTEMGLSLGHIVLDGDPAPSPLKGHSSPIFGQCPLWLDGLRYHLVWR